MDGDCSGLFGWQYLTASEFCVDIVPDILFGTLQTALELAHAGAKEILCLEFLLLDKVMELLIQSRSHCILVWLG